MMGAVKIALRAWHTSCGEPGCCDDYGTTLYVDGKKITDNFEAYQSDVETLLDALGIEYEIDEEWEDE